MESIRGILAQSIAIGVARSALTGGDRPPVETAALEPEHEAAICDALRSWCTRSGAELTRPTDAGAPRRLGTYVVALGHQSIVADPRVLVLTGALGRGGAQEGWRVLWEARERQGVSVAVLIYESSGLGAPEPFLGGNHMVVPWEQPGSFSETFLSAGLSSASALLVEKECRRRGHESAVLTELLRATEDLEYRARRLWKLAQWARMQKNRGSRAHQRVVVAEKAFDSYVGRLDAARRALEEELRDLPPG
ncbi:MAG: hypothetical protein JXA87_12485 [Thermoleophilia bacterium]|nr:hypothetical protein [Thermoleophilia bacterium]